MAATGEQLRAIEKIVRICDATTEDAVAFRPVVLEECRRVVAFDAYAWLVTDPETEVGSAPLAICRASPDCRD